MIGREPELRAILVSPDRLIAERFMASVAETRSFQIVQELSAYPSGAVLDTRIRQLQPDVVLLDLASDLDAAVELVAVGAGFQPRVHVVGLHHEKQTEALVRSLRSGAVEFLHVPFDAAEQREAVNRLRRLRAPEGPAEQQELGKVLAFASSKPGSGATTMATQAAFALRRVSGRRVLLADFDLMGGTAAFALRAGGPYSLLEALEHAERLDMDVWSHLAVPAQGLDVLPSPEVPYAGSIPQAALHTVLHFTRHLYAWVVLDLPTVFHQISLAALAECDQGFLVSTAELPSLHLTRKAVGLLGQMGMEKDRQRILVNRLDKRDAIPQADLQKLFNSPVHATLPNDHQAVSRAVALGQPLAVESELGKAINGLATQLCGVKPAEKGRANAVAVAKPAMSQT